MSSTESEAVDVEEFARAFGFTYVNEPCPVCRLADGCHDLSQHLDVSPLDRSGAAES